MVIGAVISGVYTGYSAYQNGITLEEAVMVGSVATLGSLVTVGSLYGSLNTGVGELTQAIADIPFSFEANVISTAATTAMTNNYTQKTTEIKNYNKVSGKNTSCQNTSYAGIQRYRAYREKAHRNKMLSLRDTY